MPGTKRMKFNPEKFFPASSLTQKAIHVKAGHVFPSQGDDANSIYSLEARRAKRFVVSKRGKEATIS